MLMLMLLLLFEVEVVVVIVVVVVNFVISCSRCNNIAYHIHMVLMQSDNALTDSCNSHP